jgi:hypothetical protein
MSSDLASSFPQGVLAVVALSALGIRLNESALQHLAGQHLSAEDSSLDTPSAPLDTRLVPASEEQTSNLAPESTHHPVPVLSQAQSTSEREAEVDSPEITQPQTPPNLRTEFTIPVTAPTPSAASPASVLTMYDVQESPTQTPPGESLASPPLSGLMDVDGLDSPQSMEDVEEHDPLQLMDDIDELDSLQTMEDVDELEPLQSMEDVDELESLQSTKDIDELDSLQAMEDVDELDPLQSTEDVDELEPLQSMEDDDELDPLQSMEDIDGHDPLQSRERLVGLSSDLDSDSDSERVDKALNELISPDIPSGTSSLDHPNRSGSPRDPQSPATTSTRTARKRSPSQDSTASNVSQSDEKIVPPPPSPPRKKPPRNRPQRGKTGRKRPGALSDGEDGDEVKDIKPPPTKKPRRERVGLDIPVGGVRLKAADLSQVGNTPDTAIVLHQIDVSLCCPPLAEF